MNNNTYHLYVHIDEDESKVVAGSDAGSGSDKDNNTADKSASGAMRAARRLFSVAAAVKLADNLTSFRISQVALQTGAVEYEQKLQFQYNMGKKVLGIGKAAYVGGKLGGVAGAVAGVVASTLYEGIGYLERRRAIANETAAESVSIGMMNIRAGVSGSRSTRQ